MTIKIGFKLGRDIPVDDSAVEYDMTTLKSLVRKFMANSDEVVVDILGRKHAFDFLRDGKSKHGFSFVTDKSFYFINKNFYKGLLGYWQKNKQLKIGINELTKIDTGARKYMRGLPLLIMVIVGIFMIILLLKYPGDGWYDEDMANTLLFFLIIIGPISLIYSIAILITEKRTSMTLYFSNEAVRFPVSLYGKEEIKSFYSCISKLQATNLNKSSQYEVMSEQSKTEHRNNANTDKLQSLSELSKLYEKGMLSEEEFKNLKNEILQ